MNNKDYLPLLGLLAIGGLTCIGCEKDEDKSTSSQSNTDGEKDEEKTISPVFINAHDFHDHTATYLDLPEVYYCITEARDQISPIELTVDTDLPEIPDELPVYKVIRPNFDEDYATEIAGKLNLNDNLEKIDEYDFPLKRFHFEKDGKILEVFEDGSIYVCYVIEPGRPSSLPSDEECIEIARDWLEDNGLYPKNVISISTSPIILVVAKGHEVLYEFTQNISVSFTIGINGYETQGMGAYVAVGENGEIIKAYINSPEFEEYTTVVLKQPEEVLATFEDYLDNLELFYTDSPLCLVDNIRSTMSVTDISLKYFCMLSEDSDVVALAQPILVLEGQGYDEIHPDSSSFTGRVDAVIR
jgi:hypothetical protein